MPSTSYIPFLNLQYFYCIIASFFGTECTDTTLQGSDLVVVPDAAGTSGGFWSWLWPFGHTAADVGTAGAAGIGFWSALFSSLPEPIQAAFLIGAVVLGTAWAAFSFVSYALSGVLILIIAASIGMLALAEIRERTRTVPHLTRSSGKSYGWSRWQDVLNEAMATDPRRWRASVVAADGMLGELLQKIGYSGETTSDQLRTVPEDAFVTLPAAWEAHRVKNFVASRSSDFILTQREAFRVLKLYEQVFEEFDFI